MQARKRRRFRDDEERPVKRNKTRERDRRMIRCGSPFISFMSEGTQAPVYKLARTRCSMQLHFLVELSCSFMRAGMIRSSYDTLLLTKRFAEVVRGWVRGAGIRNTWHTACIRRP